ncbi:MAG: Fe-S cluster assembly protein SufD [Methylococcales bacterium]|nr:Fe-S cluster assembly protein SufD [Methylococcales bacterium]
MSISWLNDIRQQAQNQFEKTGFPASNLEDWRYTNVSAIAKKELSVAKFVEDVDFDAVESGSAFHFVFVDGYFREELSNLPEKITICSINDALKNHTDLLQSKFNQAIQQPHGFIDFNTANFTDGLFVHIPKNAILEKPLQIIHIATQEAILPTRHVVILDANAKAELIEMFVSPEKKAYLTNSVSEIFVGENADLTLYKVQQEGENAYHFGGTYVQQADNARFTHHNFALGSLLARSDIVSDLATAAECELNGLYLGSQNQHLDNLTRINHLQPHGISREFYKGILNDQAKGVFQGRIVVAENAQKIDSQMNNRNLLLSNEAEIDTKPQLEIYADDVKCAHGVTVGQLDEKSIFYLQSRGIDEETAKHILTFAFANEMVDRVTFEPLKAQLSALLAVRYPMD